MTDVWVTTMLPTSYDVCMCWRDAVCTHGWSWQWDDVSCHHVDAYEPVHRSLADAIRSLWSERGRSGIGCLIREHYIGRCGTRVVYVFPPGTHCLDLADDHDAYEGQGPSPRWIITRESLVERGEHREFDNHYRDQ